MTVVCSAFLSNSLQTTSEIVPLLLMMLLLSPCCCRTKTTTTTTTSMSHSMMFPMMIPVPCLSLCKLYCQNWPLWVSLQSHPHRSGFAGATQRRRRRVPQPVEDQDGSGACPRFSGSGKNRVYASLSI